MSHSIKPIPVVEAYFGKGATPVIAYTYKDGGFWVQYPFRKRVSVAWLRKMRAEGVTDITLRGDAPEGRYILADFTVAELLK